MIKLSFIIIIKTTHWQNIMIWAFDCKYCLTTSSWWVDYKLVESLLTWTAVQTISSPSIPKKKCCTVKHISLQDSRFLSWTGWDNQCQRWSALCSAFCSFTFSASWKYHVRDNVSNCQVEINTTWKQLPEPAGWTFQGLYINSLLCILFQPLLKDCREKLHKNMQGEWKNL